LLDAANGDVLFSIFSTLPFGVPSCLIPTMQQSPGGEEVILKEAKVKFEKLSV
jgi:hypothetical protein